MGLHTEMADAGAELKRLEKWLAKTEEKLDGGKIVKPDSIVDACQALSKARELRAQFEKKEKPLITAKELIGDSDPEIAALSQKSEETDRLLPFQDRGSLCDLGKRPGECRYSCNREGNSSFRLQGEDVRGGPEGVRAGDPGGARQLNHL